MTLESTLQKHKTFWTRGKAEKALVYKLADKMWRDKPYPFADGRMIEDPEVMTPDDFDVSKHIENNSTERSPMAGDLIKPLGYNYSYAWMESLIGCEIYASSKSCSAKPVDNIEEAAQNFTVEKALSSPWLTIMDEMLKRAAAETDHVPTRQLHLRGIVDLLAAFMGEEKLCMGLFDNADLIKDLAEKFTELYIKVAHRGLEIRPEWHGGYNSLWHMWAQGRLIDYQIDASSLFSNDMYEEYFLEYDRQILSSTPYSMIHIHSCGMRLVEVMLKIKELTGFEMQMDKESGELDIDMYLHYCRKIQEAGRGLLIYGKMNEKELADLQEALSPDGLAIFYWEKER
ncbi:MAG: hypothetical protein ACYTFY_12760 [Planctomycetota bacterium]|jgi:hypothetical protein